MKSELEEESEIARRERKIYAEDPVPKAVAAMVIPTIISQIITVIYNLADTWYVGLTGNAAAVYSLVLGIIAIPFLMMIGGDAQSVDLAVGYAMITMVIGGIPTVLSAVFAHLIRCTGQVKVASFGITLGALLNMILDPLFMFVLLPKGSEVIGVVRKIDSFAYAINQGITQGMLPIVAYCFASGRISRMKKVVGFSAMLTVVFSLICSIGSYLFALELISFFIQDTDTIFYGAKFLRVLCIAVAIYPLLFVIIAVFQAVGEGIKTFILSLLHKGSLDIALFFVIRKLFGLEYILWSSPIMAAVALCVGIFMILRLYSWLHLL